MSVTGRTPLGLRRLLSTAVLLSLAGVLLALVAVTTFAALGAGAFENSLAGSAPGAQRALLRGAFASLGYAFAFAFVLGPVVVATLGLRARLGVRRDRGSDHRASLAR